MRERLLQAIEAIGLKKHGRVKKIHELTGYSMGSVSDMLAGRVKINGKFIRLVCNILNIRMEWVVTGEGEMFVRMANIETEKNENVMPSTPEINPVTAAALNDSEFLALPVPEQVRLIYSIMKSVAKHDE